MNDLARRIEQLSPEKRALLESRMRGGKAPRPAAIAVIGIGCRFPGGANTPQAFWQLLWDGVDAIREVPPERWSADALYDPDSTARGKMATRWGGFLDSVREFEPGFFELTEREAVRMDPQQRLMLETTWEALEDAGQVAHQLAGSATGVFVAAHNLSSEYYFRQIGERTDIDAYSATGGAHSIVSNRVSYWLDLQGPSMTVDTACSGSLVAAHLAVNSLRSGECDLAIAGGVNLMLSPEATIALSGMQMMAPDGRCKTFDARADGFVRGEGCGAVVLKRLEDAERDGDPVYAVIVGSAVNQDGRTNGLTAPNGLSQQRVLRQALRQAGVQGDDVGYVEAHGTGTAMGDPIEVEALAEVLGRGTGGPACALGSVKTNIGHLEAAAGIAGLIKAVLCLHREAIPPNLHFRSLNPHIALAGTRFNVAAERQAWPRGAKPRRAGVSSFGFGGTNAHMVLEEAPSRAPVRGTDVEPLLLVSAHDAGALDARARQYAERLAAPEASFADVCYTAACRRSHLEQRLAVTAATPEEAATALLAYAAGERPPQVVTRRAPGGRAPTTAWVFSGQGSQHVGMGRRLLATEPVFAETIRSIDAIFVRLAGWSLEEALETADDERLARTEVAQPAIFAIEVALARALGHYGLRPDAVVGHSLGEVAAACVGGALELEDAVTVIWHRGALMQQLHGAGRMAAVSAGAEDVRRQLADHPGVSLAAVNGPRSVTVSGPAEALEALLGALDAPHQWLPVQYAFHSPSMEALQPQLKSALGGIRPRAHRCPIYSTVRGALAREHDFGAEYWARNIREPVAFASAIEALAADGAGCLVEVGPQAVLGPAIEQCLESAGCRAATLGVLLRNRPENLRQVLAELHVNGLAVDWPAWFRGGGNVSRLPAYPWQRRRCWFEPSRPRDGGHAASPESLFYDLAWLLETPLDRWPARPALVAPPLADLAAAVDGARDAAYAKHGASDSRELVEGLEGLAVSLAAAALRRLGLALAPGEAYPERDVAALADGHGQRIVKRLLRLLEDAGYARFADAAWTMKSTPPEAAALPPRLLDIAGAAEVRTLLERCGNEAAAVVRHESDPLSLLFPGDYRTSAEWIYADAPFSRVANDLVADAVAALAAAQPDSRPLRILEIGAGTGGTTRVLLPRLPHGRVEYVFTDLSPSFLNKARERFRGFPLRCELLDIENDPAAQGFAAGQFDVVIAANVLHATADLGRSLQHARELLVPGGVLLLLEGTARRGWIDLTFGLTEGWWRFTDTAVRAEHPLLSREEWRELLLGHGFEDATSVAVERDPAGCLFEQGIVLARRPAGERVTAATAPAVVQAPWLVFGGGDVAEELETSLSADGTPCIAVTESPGAAPEFTAARCRVDPARREHYLALVEHVREAHGKAPGAVLHMPSSAPPPDDPEAGIARSCGGVLHLVQALAELGVEPARGVWVATRGAQPAMPGDRVLPEQAALWGLGRVAAREMTGYWGGLVDLDPVADAARDAAALRAVVEGDAGERQVALRAGDRFVARLVESPAPASTGTALRGDRSYLVTGGLGGIGLAVARWMVEHGARHLTLLGRRGLDPANARAVEGVAALERAGAAVHVAAADVADEKSMRQVFAAFGGERPPLAGIVHSAAVIRFQPFERISLDDFSEVVRAKAAGGRVLDRLTEGFELDFCAWFSSLAGLGGFPELAHYAAANCYLDALAHERRARGLPGCSIDWGLWADGQAATDQDRELFERVGLQAMPAAQALSGFERVLSAGATQVAVAAVDWQRFRPVYESRGDRRFLSRLPVPAVAEAAEAAVRQDAPRRPALTAELLAADPADVPRLLETAVAGEVAAVLGVPAGGVTDYDQGFFQMGMDSIMTVELRRRLETRLDLALPTTLAFEYPTIARLAGFLAGEIPGLATAAAAAPPPAAAAPVPDDDLEQYSEDELAAELDRELASLDEAAGGSSR